jgi:hypothetical protein
LKDYNRDALYLSQHLSVGADITARRQESDPFAAVKEIEDVLTWDEYSVKQLRNILGQSERSMIVTRMPSLRGGLGGMPRAVPDGTMLPKDEHLETSMSASASISSTTDAVVDSFSLERFKGQRQFVDKCYTKCHALESGTAEYRKKCWMPNFGDIQGIRRYYGELFEELDQLVKEKSMQESFSVDSSSSETIEGKGQKDGDNKCYTKCRVSESGSEECLEKCWLSTMKEDLQSLNQRYYESLYELIPKPSEETGKQEHGSDDRMTVLNQARKDYIRLRFEL